MESILDSIKKMHGISPDDTSFDTDMVIHINSAFMKVTKLGAGPRVGFVIKDKTKLWSDFSDDEILVSAVQSFVYIKVRLVFDPPASPTIVDALQASAEEDAWQIRDWVESNAQYQ